MSCVLRARGTDFAVDNFLVGSTLEPGAVFRRGQPRSSRGSAILNASGFHAIASEADFSNLQVQIADAVRFLEQNHSELERLVGFPGVEVVSLDFGIEERDVAAQSERFPPRLLLLLGNLGIELEFTLYPRQEPKADAGSAPDV
jgi:hypothetical protein